MSERQFPLEHVVSEAYHDVLVTNQTMASHKEVRQTFGLPSEHTQVLSGEFTTDYSAEESSEYLRPLNMQYGRLFSAIGIELDINDTLDPVTGNRFFGADRVVPELLDPDRYQTYLGHIGIQSAYGNPLQLQLAKDVITHLYNIVRACDRFMTSYQESHPDNPGHALRISKGYQTHYLNRFRRVMPFYSAANFGQCMPDYVELEKRVLGKPDFSL